MPQRRLIGAIVSALALAVLSIAKYYPPRQPQSPQHSRLPQRLPDPPEPRAALPSTVPPPLLPTPSLPIARMPSAPTVAPPPPVRPPRSFWKVHLSQRRRGVDFAGAPTLAERADMLAGCQGSETKCGFITPSGYDALATQAASSSAHCAIVVLTAIFGRKDKLQQPARVPTALRDCYFAVVDTESAAFLIETAPRAVRRASDAAAPGVSLSPSRVGAWRLLTLQLATSPYPQPRRASRVPKLLPFRLFPRSNYSIWIDGKLKLLESPASLVERFLSRPRAALALPRNLRRNHIDEEMRWIRATLTAEPHKLRAVDAVAVEAQWAFYSAEQYSRHRNSSAWTKQTACAEGAMIVMDLRSDVARCVMCAWLCALLRMEPSDQRAASSCVCVCVPLCSCVPPHMPNMCVAALTLSAEHTLWTPSANCCSSRLGGRQQRVAPLWRARPAFSLICTHGDGAHTTSRRLANGSQ